VYGQELIDAQAFVDTQKVMIVKEAFHCSAGRIMVSPPSDMGSVRGIWAGPTKTLRGGTQGVPDLMINSCSKPNGIENIYELSSTLKLGGLYIQLHIICG
jgi:hypothetical protein